MHITSRICNRLHPKSSLPCAINKAKWTIYC